MRLLRYRPHGVGRAGHWQQMRELSRAVNEEIRVARELVRASVAWGVPMGKTRRPLEC
jgi:hypothetical protein